MDDRTTSDIEVGDHVRPKDETHPAGVYRVVGTGDSIILLRITDEDDRRRATGELRSVPAGSVSNFEPATNPDAGLRPLAWLRSLLSGIYWEFRMVLDWLRRR